MIGRTAIYPTEKTARLFGWPIKSRSGKLFAVVEAVGDGDGRASRDGGDGGWIGAHTGNRGRLAGVGYEAGCWRGKGSMFAWKKSWTPLAVNERPAPTLLMLTAIISRERAHEKLSWSGLPP